MSEDNDNVVGFNRPKTVAEAPKHPPHYNYEVTTKNGVTRNFEGYAIVTSTWVGVAQGEGAELQCVFPLSDLESFVLIDET